MRLTVTLFLDDEADKRNDQARNAIADLLMSVTCHPKPLTPGDSIVIKDDNGNRIGVADVYNW
jgi:hypothetical protein